MKYSLILLVLLPVAFSMNIPLEGEKDLHQEEINRIRLLSLGQPDEAVGEILKNWKPEDGTNPEELGSYFEGDILTVPSSLDKNGQLNTTWRWPNNTIPYKIEGNFSIDHNAVILKAMEMISASTCIRFQPHDGIKKDYVIIKTNETGCWSTAGRKGGPQFLNLQNPGCTSVGTAIHEMIHAIGFFHEQSRLDRDTFVNILWQNIAVGKEHNFNKKDYTTTFGVAYDFDSIMHYGKTAFTINKEPTIESKNGQVFGQRLNLSISDAKKINLMYKCPVQLEL